MRERKKEKIKGKGKETVLVVEVYSDDVERSGCDELVRRGEVYECKEGRGEV